MIQNDLPIYKINFTYSLHSFIKVAFLFPLYKIFVSSSLQTINGEPDIQQVVFTV